MKTIFTLIFLLISSVALSEEDDFFYLNYNKCVYNQINFSKSKDFKIIAAPNLTIICSKDKNNDKIKCKIMETESGNLLIEKEFELEINFQGMIQLKAKDHDYQKIVIQKESKGSMYFYKEMPGINEVKETVCSGTYNTAKDVQKLMDKKKSPIEFITPKKKTLSNESSPSLIGY